MNPITKRTIILGVLSIVGLILFLIVNPFSWNDAGNRTVVERTTGEQIVQFAPGIFYAGFFAKEKEWPNQISVTYQEENPQLELEDNGIAGYTDTDRIITSFQKRRNIIRLVLKTLVVARPPRR